MKLYLLLFFISAQFTIASILENDFIIISGMQSDLDKRENLQTTIDSAQPKAFTNTAHSIGACTTFLIDSLYQQYPTNIIVTENILVNLISYAQMFKQFLNNELEKDNDAIYQKLKTILPSPKFCQWIDGFINQELASQTDHVTFEPNQYKEFINAYIFNYPLDKLDFMQKLNIVTYFEILLYRAPLNKYKIIELTKPEEALGNKVYWLKPKNTLEKDPILVKLEEKALTPEYINIKCNSSDTLTQIILNKELVNNKSSIVLQGHGSQNLGGAVAGIKDEQLQKILDKFALVKINALFIISCYATRLVHLNKKFQFSRPIVIQGESENPSILTIRTPSISTSVSGKTQEEKIILLNKKSQTMHKAIEFTLKIPLQPLTYYNFDAFFNHVKNFSSSDFLTINYKETFDTLIINPLYKSMLKKRDPGILFPIYVKVPISSEKENYNDLIPLTVILAILKNNNL